MRLAGWVDQPMAAPAGERPAVQVAQACRSTDIASPADSRRWRWPAAQLDGCPAVVGDDDQRGLVAVEGRFTWCASMRCRLVVVVAASSGPRPSKMLACLLTAGPDLLPKSVRSRATLVRLFPVRPSSSVISDSSVPGRPGNQQRSGGAGRVLHDAPPSSRHACPLVGVFDFTTAAASLYTHPGSMSFQHVPSCANPPQNENLSQLAAPLHSLTVLTIFI